MRLPDEGCALAEGTCILDCGSLCGWCMHELSRNSPGQGILGNSPEMNRLVLGGICSSVG